MELTLRQSTVIDHFMNQRENCMISEVLMTVNIKIMIFGDMAQLYIPQRYNLEKQLSCLTGLMKIKWHIRNSSYLKLKFI
jgi:hypothetical protein